MLNAPPAHRAYLGPPRIFGALKSMQLHSDLLVRTSCSCRVWRITSSASTWSIGTPDTVWTLGEHAVFFSDGRRFPRIFMHQQIVLINCTSRFRQCRSPVDLRAESCVMCLKIGRRAFAFFFARQPGLTAVG